MSPRAFLIHGWAGSPEEAWRPWLRDELESRGFEVKMPAMPDSEHPKMEAWVKTLSQTVGDVDENCFFEQPIDWEAIRSHGGRVTAIHSDNDFYVSLHYADFFKKELGAKIVIESGHGHFSGSNGITQLPSALEAIL